MTEKAQTTSLLWSYNSGPRIGTCGEPCDILRVAVPRARAIPDLLVAFDGERGGWSVGGSFYTPEGKDFEFCELAFIPEYDLEEARLRAHNIQKEEIARQIVREMVAEIDREPLK